MASKVSVFAALFVCFLVLADASFRVTTTVVEEEENPQQRQQCQQQLQRQRLQSCHNYVQRQQRSGRNDDDEWDILEVNPQRGQQQSIQQCCDELQQVDRECRCQALEELQREAQRSQQGGRSTGRQQQGSQQQRVQQQIRSIPQMCSLQVPQQCQQGY